MLLARNRIHSNTIAKKVNVQVLVQTCLERSSPTVSRKFMVNTALHTKAWVCVVGGGQLF
jgi:hypothetical protein